MTVFKGKVAPVVDSNFGVGQVIVLRASSGGLNVVLLPVGGRKKARKQYGSLIAIGPLGHKGT